MRTQRIDPELSRACVEAFRRSYGGRSAQQKNKQRVNESAAAGSTVQLRESNIMDTPQSASNSQGRFDKMVESFKRLGYSDTAAREAARGREGDYVDQPIGSYDIPSNRAVVYHPTEAEYLRESERMAEVRESHAQLREIRESMKENFMRMGLSEREADIAAKGRGYYR